MRKIVNIIVALIFILLVGCTTENSYDYELVQSGDHGLAVISTGKGDTSVVFVNALGDSLDYWIDYGIEVEVSEHANVVLYNRTGVEPSEVSENPPTIENMVKDLDNIVSTTPKNNNIILVGHSLGGAIIRSYAVKYPKKVSGLVFVDSSHEVSLDLWTPAEGKQFGDEFVESLINDGWPENHPAVKEAKEFRNTLLHLKSLNKLPDVPVTAITAMADSSSPEKLELWKSGHISLGEGVSDFTHIEALNSEHYIQEYEPELIINAILNMIE